VVLLPPRFLGLLQKKSAPALDSLARLVVALAPQPAWYAASPGGAKTVVAVANVHLLGARPANLVK
jgi:hypothetical protein